MSDNVSGHVNKARIVINLESNLTPEHLYLSSINSAGKRDRICVLFSSDKLLVTNRPKAAAEGSGLRPLSYPRNGRGPLPKAAARAPFGFAVPQKVEVRVAQFHS